MENMKEAAQNSMKKQSLMLSDVISAQSIEKFQAIQDKIALIQTADSNKELTQMAVAAVKANVIAELQLALPDEFVKNIKKTLENSRLGFKTDRTDGYDVSIIRTCLIEAAVQGFYWHGNEFNIIAGNAYFTKDGLTNKMKREHEYTDVKLSFGVPDLQIANGRALITVKATWKYNGVADSIEETIPVKLLVKNGINYTTDDAIIGKANRKIRARIIEQSTGNPVPEADLDEINKEIDFNKVPEVPYSEEKNGLFEDELTPEMPAYWISLCNKTKTKADYQKFRKDNDRAISMITGKDGEAMNEAFNKHEQSLKK